MTYSELILIEALGFFVLVLFRKKIKQMLFKRQAKKALAFLSVLEPLMKKAGISRQTRRFLWQSMPKEEARKKAIDYLSKELQI